MINLFLQLLVFLTNCLPAVKMMAETASIVNGERPKNTNRLITSITTTKKLGFYLCLP
jgi:hypothetical protein